MKLERNMITLILFFAIGGVLVLFTISGAGSPMVFDQTDPLDEGDTYAFTDVYSIEINDLDDTVDITLYDDKRDVSVSIEGLDDGEIQEVKLGDFNVTIQALQYNGDVVIESEYNRFIDYTDLERAMINLLPEFMILLFIISIVGLIIIGFKDTEGV